VLEPGAHASKLDNRSVRDARADERVA